MLTPQKIVSLNNQMLSSKPGYNHMDKKAMSPLKYFDILDDTQLYRILKTLAKYANTQLAAYKPDIEDTLNYYIKLIKTVSVVNVSSYCMSISWPYDPAISSALKRIDSTHYRWTKIRRHYALQVRWKYLPEIIKLLSSYDLDCSTILSIKRPPI